MNPKILKAAADRFYILPICFIFILLHFSFVSVAGAESASAEASTTPYTTASTIKKIAIVPFEINSQQDISYIKNGIFQMLSSRLAWKGNTSVGAANKPNVDISQFDYVVKGSITEFAGAFSVDATVYNVSEKQSQSFFAQAENQEKIIPSVELLSAKINKDIFNRDTEALALVDDQKSKAAIRANPEKLIPQAAIQPAEKKRPFWKFWGKDKSEDQIITSSQSSFPASVNGSSATIDKSEPEEKIVLHTEIDPEDEEELEKEKKPFWKFW